MTIDWTKPVRFKHTKAPLRVLCTDSPSSRGEVVVMDFNGNTHRYSIDGTSRYPGHQVENIPEEVTAPLFVYNYKNHYYAYKEDRPGPGFTLVGKLNLTISDNRITKCEIL